MGKTILATIVLLFLLSETEVICQEGFSQLDKKTYQLYEQGNWQALTKLADKGIKEGIDYYYLRMRAGIAWFEIGDYEKSSKHFSAALGFSEHDPLALEYLYYSYIYLGKKTEALLLSVQFSQSLKNKLKIKEDISLSSAFFETGMFNNISLDELTGSLPEGDFVSSYFLKDLRYYNGGLNINLGYNIQVKLAFNKFSINTIQLTGLAGEEIDFDHTGNQTGVYLNLNYQLKNGWSFGGAYHGINGSYSSSYYLANAAGQYSFQTKSDRFSHNYLGAYLVKRIPYLGANIHLSQNTFWQGKYYQIGCNLAYYPLGNTSLYLTGGYDRLIAGEGNSASHVLKGSLGFRILNKIWIEGNIANGDLSNWANSMGTYVFNTPYPILSKIGVYIYSIEIIPRLSLSLSISQQNREHHTNIYALTGEINTEIQNYKTNSYIGGISWRF